MNIETPLGQQITRIELAAASQLNDKRLRINSLTLMTLWQIMLVWGIKYFSQENDGKFGIIDGESVWLGSVKWIADNAAEEKLKRRLHKLG